MEQGSVSIQLHRFADIEKKITIHNDSIKARLLLLYRVII